MATKFSGFTAGATTANTLVVGYDSVLNTNNQYTLSQLSTGLTPFLPANELLVNETVYVDAVNGNDGTGAVGNMSKAYATITAAKTAASVGDIVHVRPGTYQEDDICKDGVAMYFDKGAIVHPTDAQQTASTKAILHADGFVNQLVILGHGEFISDCSYAPTATGVGYFDTDSVHCEFFQATYTNGNASGAIKGTFVLEHIGTNDTEIFLRGNILKDETTGGVSQNGVYIVGGGRVQLECNVTQKNTSDGGSAIYINSGSSPVVSMSGNIYVEAPSAPSPLGNYGIRTGNNYHTIIWNGNIELGTHANGYAIHNDGSYNEQSNYSGFFLGPILLSLNGLSGKGTYINGTQYCIGSPNGYAFTCNDDGTNVVDLAIVSNIKIFDISLGVLLFQGSAQTLSDNAAFLNCTGGKFIFNGVVNDQDQRLTNSTITGGEVVIQSDFESWGSNYPNDEYVFYVNGGTLRVDGCKIENHQTTTGSGVIEYVSGNLILNGATLVSESVDVTTFSIKVVGALNYIGYNDSFANMAVGGGGSLTNLITGGGIIVVDTDVE